jgi:hypothetical protein
MRTGTIKQSVASLLTAHAVPVDAMAVVVPLRLIVYRSGSEVWSLPLRPMHYLRELRPGTSEAMAYLGQRQPYVVQSVPRSDAGYNMARRLQKKMHQAAK